MEGVSFVMVASVLGLELILEVVVSDSILRKHHIVARKYAEFEPSRINKQGDDSRDLISTRSLDQVVNSSLAGDQLEILTIPRIPEALFRRNILKGKLNEAEPKQYTDQLFQSNTEGRKRIKHIQLLKFEVSICKECNMSSEPLTILESIHEAGEPQSSMLKWTNQYAIFLENENQVNCLSLCFRVKCSLGFRALVLRCRESDSRATYDKIMEIFIHWSFVRTNYSEQSQRQKRDTERKVTYWRMYKEGNVDDIQGKQLRVNYTQRDSSRWDRTKINEKKDGRMKETIKKREKLNVLSRRYSYVDDPGKQRNQKGSQKTQRRLSANHRRRGKRKQDEPNNQKKEVTSILSKNQKHGSRIRRETKYVRETNKNKGGRRKQTKSEKRSGDRRTNSIGGKRTDRSRAELEILQNKRENISSPASRGKIRQQGRGHEGRIRNRGSLERENLVRREKPETKNNRAKSTNHRSMGGQYKKIKKDHQENTRFDKRSSWSRRVKAGTNSKHRSRQDVSLGKNSSDNERGNNKQRNLENEKRTKDKKTRKKKYRRFGNPKGKPKGDKPIVPNEAGKKIPKEENLYSSTQKVKLKNKEQKIMKPQGRKIHHFGKQAPHKMTKAKKPINVKEGREINVKKNRDNKNIKGVEVQYPREGRHNKVSDDPEMIQLNPRRNKRGENSKKATRKHMHENLNGSVTKTSKNRNGTVRMTNYHDHGSASQKMKTKAKKPMNSGDRKRPKYEQKKGSIEENAHNSRKGGYSNVSRKQVRTQPDTRRSNQSRNIKKTRASNNQDNKNVPEHMNDKAKMRIDSEEEKGKHSDKNSRKKDKTREQKLHSPRERGYNNVSGRPDRAESKKGGNSKEAGVKKQGKGRKAKTSAALERNHQYHIKNSPENMKTKTTKPIKTGEGKDRHSEKTIKKKNKEIEGQKELNSRDGGNNNNLVHPRTGQPKPRRIKQGGNNKEASGKKKRENGDGIKKSYKDKNRTTHGKNNHDHKSESRKTRITAKAPNNSGEGLNNNMRNMKKENRGLHGNHPYRDENKSGSTITKKKQEENTERVGTSKIQRVDQEKYQNGGHGHHDKHASKGRVDKPKKKKQKLNSKNNNNNVKIRSQNYKKSRTEDGEKQNGKIRKSPQNKDERKNKKKSHKKTSKKEKHQKLDNRKQVKNRHRPENNKTKKSGQSMDKGTPHAKNKTRKKFGSNTEELNSKKIDEIEKSSKKKYHPSTVTGRKNEYRSKKPKQPKEEQDRKSVSHKNKSNSKTHRKFGNSMENRHRIRNNIPKKNRHITLNQTERGSTNLSIEKHPTSNSETPHSKNAKKNKYAHKVENVRTKKGSQTERSPKKIPNKQLQSSGASREIKCKSKKSKNFKDEHNQKLAKNTENKGKDKSFKGGVEKNSQGLKHTEKRRKLNSGGNKKKKGEPKYSTMGRKRKQGSNERKHKNHDVGKKGRETGERRQAMIRGRRRPIARSSARSGLVNGRAMTSGSANAGRGVRVKSDLSEAFASAGYW